MVNHWNQGILLWTIGDRSHQTFEQLWQIIKCWRSFWYVTDGWKVYPMYIQPEDHLVSKTYMTRVEGENTRLRHYLARLHRKTLCYSKSVDMQRVFYPLVAILSKVQNYTRFCLKHYAFTNAMMCFALPNKRVTKFCFYHPILLILIVSNKTNG